MKNFIVIGIIALVVLVGLAYVITDLGLFKSSQEPITPGSTTGPIVTDIPYTGPTSGSTGTASGRVEIATVLVPTETGGPISVRDFKQNPTTVVSPNIPGYFFLSGGLNPSGTGAPYSTFFATVDGSFSVTLLKEPISATRREAEKELMGILGASQDEMCALRYWIGVYKETNVIYADRNLGFSFCPGATELP